MAHEVTILDGVAQAAYAKVPAWHNLGQVFPDLLTTTEAIKASGIDFEVTKRQLFTSDLSGNFVPVEGFQAIYGGENYGVVGIHTDEYEPDRFGDHVRALGFAKDAKVWECMVNLRNGKMFTGTVRLPDLDMILPDGSHYVSCIVVYSSHDGTYAITIKDSAYRAECANMLRAVDGTSGGRVFRIRHTSGKDANRANAASVMTYAQERADYHERLATRLLKHRMSTNDVTKVLNAVWPLVRDNEALEGGKLTIATNNREKLLSIYNNVDDQQTIKGTAWGLAQAFGNFADHESRTRGSNDTQRAENRFIRSVLKGNTVAEQALTVINDMVPQLV